MSIGTSPDKTPRFAPVDGEAVPAGKVRLAFVESRDSRSIDMWFGNVQRDGLYINMQSPRRDLVLAAAEALRPIELHRRGARGPSWTGADDSQRQAALEPVNQPPYA